MLYLRLSFAIRTGRGQHLLGVDGCVLAWSEDAMVQDRGLRREARPLVLGVLIRCQTLCEIWDPAAEAFHSV